MPSYQIHGPGLPCYQEQPPIYATVSYGSVTRPNSGDNIQLSLSATLDYLGGANYFGYTIDVYASLDSTNSADAVHIISKPASPSQWGGGLYGLGQVTLTSTNLTTSCVLYLWLKANCDCNGNPDGAMPASPSIVQTIYLTAPEAGNKPANPVLSNNNKYTNPSTGIQNNVSASMTSLTIGVSTSDWGKPDEARIYWSCDNGGGSGDLARASEFTISDLNPGTTYTVSVYLQNSRGASSTAKITIRTRYAEPVVNLTLADVDLEQLIFNWTSDKDLKSTEYKIDDGDWTDLEQTGTSGSFTAQWFEPKTEHTIYFRGISTNALDSLNSNEADASGITHDRAHITSIGECIFGLDISLEIASESDKQLMIEVWTEGNNLSPRFTFDDIGVGDRTWIFSPTQDQLDQMYRCYPKANTIPIHFLITTHGEWKDWQDAQQDETLTLTGIAKTAHVGDESNKPRRCQVWVGDESDKPRRAVGWVGVNEEAHRTI